MKLKHLAQLCRRLAMALGAGIDVRTIWAREVERAPGWAARQRILSVSEAVERGESLGAAIAATDGFFPPLLAELVEVGEQTGRLSEVFAQLAEHYEGRLRLRRVFLGAIAWPMLELALAVVVVGILIAALGVIEQITGSRVDPLGWGLVGVAGLVKYVAFLAVVGLAIFVVAFGVRRGLAWTRPFQRGVLRVPLLGKALQTVALARLAWALHLTLNTEMDVRRALRLSLETTRNARYTDPIGRINAEIDGGSTMVEALRSADFLPADFLDSVAVGEQTGELVESMARLSQVYQDQARLALAALNVLAGLAVFVAVAMIIIVLIFQIAAFIFGVYNDALKM